MGRLEGKIAVITGAGGDIGTATAVAFAREGATVACFDVDPKPAARCAQAVMAQGGVARHYECDVSDSDSVRKTMSAVAEHFSGVDVLVNNAAISSPYEPVHTLPESAWRKALDVNLTGAFLISKYAVPLMMKRGRGSIIHMASQMGHVGNKGRAAYGATKAALIHLARIMALDYAEMNIRVNSLSPGAVLTSRVVGRYGSEDAARQRLEPLYPIKRLGTPQEIAAAVVFLASDESSFMTGADLLLDGGYTAQ